MARPVLSNVPLWMEKQLPILRQLPQRAQPSSGLSFAQTLAQAAQPRPLTPARPPRPLIPFKPLSPLPPPRLQQQPSLIDPRPKASPPPTPRPAAPSPALAPQAPLLPRVTSPLARDDDYAPLGPETGLPLGAFAPQPGTGANQLLPGASAGTQALPAASALSQPQSGASTISQAQPGVSIPAPHTAPQTPWLPVDQYPRPRADNGRGMHWLPTTSQTPAVVDRFVAEAKNMGITWVTFLNKGANVGENDYLVKKLTAAGIEPIMRVYANGLSPVDGDVTSMVRHYVDMGVHYFQAYNEPNLAYEQGGPPSVDRYLDAWLPVAKQVLAGGGLPGFGAMAPGGDVDDVKFLQDALDGLKRRGEVGVLDKGWLSMHNYTWNEPINQDGIANPNGFEKFRTYARIVRQALGRDLPIIGTEGGTYAGDHQDAGRVAVSETQAVDMARQAYRYMRDQREPWNFAYSYWVIANGADPSFSHQALFRDDGTTSPIVSALQAMAQGQA